MEGHLQRIKDNASLFRDVTTNAILNKDRSAYESYVASYNKLKEQQKEFDELKDEVKSINSDISEIKTLLHTLIGRENHGD
jgi:septal ring factor EnvC (AmiA/AmiB activator)